jgi:hypothetical protein
LRKDRVELRRDFRNGGSREEIARNRSEVREDWQKIAASRNELRESQAKLDAARLELKRDLRNQY